MPTVDQQRIAWLESLLDVTIGCYEDHRQELEKVRRELARHGAAGKCVHLGPERAGQLVSEIDVVLARSALRLEDFDPQRDYVSAKNSEAGAARRDPPARSACTPQVAAIPVRQGFTNPRASAGAGSVAVPTPTAQPNASQSTSQPQQSPPQPPRATAPHPMALRSEPNSAGATPPKPPRQPQPRAQPQPALQSSTTQERGDAKTCATPPQPPRQPAPATSERPSGAGVKQPSIQADNEYPEEEEDGADDVSDYCDEIQQRYADAEEYEPGVYHPYPSALPQQNLDERHPRDRAAYPLGEGARHPVSSAGAAPQPPHAPGAGHAGDQNQSQPERTSQGRRNYPYEPLLTPPYVMPPVESDTADTRQTRQERQVQQGAAPSPYRKSPTPISANTHQQPSGAASVPANTYGREPSTATSVNPPPSDSYMTTSNRPQEPMSGGVPRGAGVDNAAAADSRRPAASAGGDVCSSRAGMEGEEEDEEPGAVGVEATHNGRSAEDGAVDGLNDDRPNEPRPQFETLAEHERPLRNSDGERPRAQRRELRTAEFRRHSPAFNNSRNVQDKVFKHRLDPVAPTLVEDSPAVEDFMSRENEELERAKAEELERLRKSFKPEQMLAVGGPMRRAVESGALVTVEDSKSGALVLAKAPPPPPDTATVDQLKRERAVLNIQMERLEREFDKAVRMHKESGSEMRYQQLHSRMNRVKRDMERVDRELAEVQRLQR